ncbi:MAG TPA: cell division protein ZapA [Bacteroidetes bacterium]|nr:cell division protein ZapA [Bacteroidota bacterium]
MEEKFTIRVNVADRYYPLKIDRLDEEKIRRAARMINEKVLQYKQRYADKDSQDFLAMAALQFVVKFIDCEKKTDIFPILEDIQELNKELEEYLSK